MSSCGCNLFSIRFPTNALPLFFVCYCTHSLQKIEYKGITYKNQATDVHQVVEESVELCVNPNKTIELVYDVSADVPSLVSVDSTRLRQVLVNLIGESLLARSLS